jgi:hypothetical protein
MNALSRSLAILAVAGHLCLTIADAFAKGEEEEVYGRPAASLMILAQSSPGNGGHYGGVGPGDGSHGAGPATIFGPGPSQSGACGGALQLSDPTIYADPIDGVAAISEQTQHYIQQCGCKAQGCVADALDAYASALDKVTAAAPQAGRSLPSAIRDLPRIVRKAAADVRAASTPRAAVKVLQAAIAVVHKTVAKSIALMRAADPDAKSSATRGGDLVAATLKTAAVALEHSDSL